MLLNKIEEDLRLALKSKEPIKVDTLRMLKAALSNYLIQSKKQTADDSEVIVLIQKQVKMRQESIESFKKAGRQDLLAKETEEKEILEAYLPKPLSDDELNALIKSVIASVGAKNPSDMGRVMKETLSKAQGRADGKRVSELVAAALKS